MAELRDFQSRVASREVIGCLILNPLLLIEHKIDLNDFVEPFYKLLFLSINNLYTQGATKLDPLIIESYIQENHPSKFKIFTRNGGVDSVEAIMRLAQPENFESNYKELRKFSLLRDLLKQGIDVSDYFDPDELDPEISEQKRDFFEENSIEDMLNFYKKKLMILSQIYSVKHERDSIKAGGELAKKQKEKWKESPAFGLGYFSKYLTTATYGLRQKRFTVMSAPTGTGEICRPRDKLNNTWIMIAELSWKLS